MKHRKKSLSKKVSEEEKRIFGIIGETPVSRIVKKAEMGEEKYSLARAWVELLRMKKTPQDVYKEVGPESRIYEGIGQMLRWRREFGEKGLGKRLREIGVEDVGEIGRIMLKLDSLEKTFGNFMSEIDKETSEKMKRRKKV